MKPGLTKLVFVIDRSSSMKKVESTMITGLNNFLGDQRNNRLGECHVSVYKFNSQYNAVFETVDLDDVTPLDSQDFQASGSTSLLDAIGVTIGNVETQINTLPEGDKPDRVLIVIWTAGLESSSQTHTRSSIHDLIQQKTNSGSWDFAFVSTTQDEETVGKKYGVSSDSSSDYVASVEGIGKMFTTLGEAAVQFRSGSIRRRFKFENKKDV